MKQLKIIIFLSSLLFLMGCCNSAGEDIAASEEQPIGTVNDVRYEGTFGTYEWVETFVRTSKPIQENHVKLYHIIVYTNTTNQAVIPMEVLNKELALQHETDIELNDIGFLWSQFYEKGLLSQDQEEMIDVSFKNIKPGATVNVLVSSELEKSRVDSIYLRNRLQNPADRVEYEKKISIKNPEDLNKVYP